MKVISMTDFVLEQAEIYRFRDDCEFAYIVRKYANFLKQPLELRMFIPCDENGNYLPEPESRGVHPHYITEPTNEELEAYNDWLEAKERCLFKGFKYQNSICVSNDDIDIYIDSDDIKVYNGFEKHYTVNTIEDLLKFDLELTPTAQKQIGL